MASQLLFFVDFDSPVYILDRNVGKVCPGAANDDSKSGNDREHYERLKEMYTNCTYVLGNIEIFSMDSLTGVTFDFFHNITEVSGYVRIMGPLPNDTRTLPFPKLRIIRGDSLTAYSDNSPNEYSLFIYNAIRVNNLGLTSLRGKSKLILRQCESTISNLFPPEDCLDFYQFLK